jgi:predicted Zn-dependent protease
LGKNKYSLQNLTIMNYKLINHSLLIAVLFLFSTCARNPVTGKRQLSLMSTKQEMAMGLSSDPQVQAEFGMYPDTSLQNFIENKGQAMAKISHRSKLPFHFRLVDSPVVNAFAVPGGYVYFTRGIMAHFNNEAQFAGVLGHEIGHVTARHGMESYTKGMLGQIGLVIAMIASPKFAQFGDAASQGLQLLMLKNSRENETQSDELGVEYSTKIGYDAKEMADFFQTLKRITLKATGGEKIPDFLSTHPDPDDRYNKVRLRARGRQQKVPGPFAINRNQYLHRIDGLIYGDDPAQGFVENNVFYHPGLKFKFPVPQGWRTENTPSQFVMAPKDQTGVMIMTLSAQKDLRSAAAEVTKQFSLRVLDQATATVNGLNAYVTYCEQVPADQQQQQQQAQPTQQGRIKTKGAQQQDQAAQASKVMVLTYYIQYEGNIYLFHGISEQKDIDRHKSNFMATMKGFEKLSDPTKLGAKPERIRIKTIEKDQTLAEALKGYGIATDRLEELAILNGMKQSDIVTKGMLIKSVEK